MNHQLKPCDIIVGDWDGVCVVPREIENKVIKGALEKARQKLLQVLINS